MNPERLVAALDIGSAKTTALIAEVEGDNVRLSARLDAVESIFQTEENEG